MTQLTKRSKRFPDVPSFLSGFFDDDPFFSRDWFPRMREDWGNMPAANVKETDKAFSIELAVPGLEKEDFTIDIDRGLMTVSAERKEEKEDKDDGYTRQEFSYSSFKRTFQLPDIVEEDDIKAKYDNGLLMLTLPKKEEAQKEEPRKAISIS